MVKDWNEGKEIIRTPRQAESFPLYGCCSGNTIWLLFKIILFKIDDWISIEGFNKGWYSGLLPTEETDRKVWTKKIKCDILRTSSDTKMTCFWEQYILGNTDIILITWTLGTAWLLYFVYALRQYKNVKRWCYKLLKTINWYLFCF